MKKLFSILFLLVASMANAQVVTDPQAGGGGAITSGSSVTSGCLSGGGVLRSVSNVLQCGAGLAFDAGILSVGTASTTRGGLDLYGATHAFRTRFQVSESQGAGITYTLPTTDGSNLDVLQTDGSGVLAWTALPSTTITHNTTPTSGCTAGALIRSTSNLADCGAGLTYIGPTLKVASAATSTQAIDIRATSVAPVHLTIFSTSNNGFGTFSVVSGTGSAGGDVYGLGYAANIGGPTYPLTWSDAGWVKIGSDSVTGTTVAATINGGTSTGRILDVYRAATGSDVLGIRVMNTASTVGSNASIQLAAVAGVLNTPVKITADGIGSSDIDLVFYGVNADASEEKARVLANGGLKIATGTKPTCDSTYRGTLYYVAGGAGVADTYEVCKKDAGDAYAWASIF